MTAFGAVELVPIGAELPSGTLSAAAARLAALLKRNVRVGEPLQPPRVPQSGPVAPGEFLDVLMRSRSTAPAPPPAAIGVTARDLGTTDRPFVFGQATVGGPWAIVSTARLTAPVAGGTLDLERLLKVLLHELGHIAGLGHCALPRCAMHPAVVPADLDSRSTAFCDACNPRFEAATRP